MIYLTLLKSQFQPFGTIVTMFNIVISNGDENATINIAPETGYAHITYN